MVKTKIGNVNQKKVLVGTIRPDLLRFLTSYLSSKGYTVILTINEFEGVIRLVNEQCQFAIFERALFDRAVRAGIVHSLGADKVDTLICLVGDKKDCQEQLQFKNVMELPENPSAAMLNKIIAGLETSGLAA
jgi:hypothetical protein